MSGENWMERTAVSEVIGSLSLIDNIEDIGSIDLRESDNPDLEAGAILEQILLNDRFEFMSAIEKKEHLMTHLAKLKEIMEEANNATTESLRKVKFNSVKLLEAVARKLKGVEEETLNADTKLNEYFVRLGVK